MPPATLEINYSVPDNVEQVSLSVSASDKIRLQSPTDISLSLSGKLRVQYLATVPGEHNIFLHIQGWEGTKPLVKRQRIDVRAR